MIVDKTDFISFFSVGSVGASFIGAHGTDVSVGVQLLSGGILLQAKKSTSHRWDSNPWVPADSMAIAACVLSYFATCFYFFASGVL